MPLHLRSPANQQFVQQLVWTKNKEYIKAVYYWPFVKGIHWFPHKGLFLWKVMSCHYFACTKNYRFIYFGVFHSFPRKWMYFNRSFNILFFLDNKSSLVQAMVWHHTCDCFLSTSEVTLNDMGKIDQHQAPVPLSIFRSNSKFDENSKHSSVKYTRPITTIFCTRHCRDVCKISLWSVEYILNFHRISNSIEICLVGRAPDHNETQPICIILVFTV